MKSDQLNLIFVHIPKCGGSSVEDLLFSSTERRPENFWMGIINPNWRGDKRNLTRFERSVRRVLGRPKVMMNKYQTGGLQHLTALQLRHAIGRSNFNLYFKFAVVRHPTARSLSQYNYMQRRPDLRRWIGMRKEDSFQTYLEKTYVRHHVQWQTQISFVNDFLGNRLVDEVVPLERLDEGMGPIFDKLGLPRQQIPHVNKGSGRRPSELNSRERELIWELYREDFESFGYRLDDHPPAGN